MIIQIKLCPLSATLILIFLKIEKHQKSIEFDFTITNECTLRKKVNLLEERETVARNLSTAFPFTVLAP